MYTLPDLLTHAKLRENMFKPKHKSEWRERERVSALATLVKASDTHALAVAAINSSQPAPPLASGSLNIFNF